MSWQKEEIIYLKYITLYILCIYKAMIFVIKAVFSASFLQSSTSHDLQK